MSKTITIKLTKAGNRTSVFSISDDLGNLLGTNITKSQLMQGVSFSIDSSVNVIILSTIGLNCNKSINLPITSLSLDKVAALKFENVNTGSLWRHLTNPSLYNSFYGVVSPYIIEYPFAYQYNDEIVQNVKDYTKVYKYLSTDDGVFNSNRRIETDSDYFNKTVLYNDQQSSGILELAPKPINNLNAYLKYPKYNADSKTILFSKRDNFYQYNTFWDVSKDKTVPNFTNSCVSLSIDKEVNQDNMIYTNRSFKKFPIRAKDLRVRHMLTDRSDIHLVSQFLISTSQVSYL
jgi:hypothetical protein